MAWAQTLQDASFRGLAFEIVKTDDAADRSVVEHSYPYVDGSDVEDMGRGARHISVEAVFYGADYETRLNKFLRALDGYDDRFSNPQDHPNAYLVHPVFGDVLVKVARYAVHHDAENVDQASVIVDFIESTPGNPFFSRELASQKADAVSQHGGLATAAATSGISSIIDRLRAANPLAGLDALRETLTAPLLEITAQGGVVLSGLDVLAYPRAWGNDISALVGGLLDMRDFGSSLTADWAGIKSDLSAFSIFSTPPAAPPAQVSSSVAPTEAQAIAATAATVKVNKAVGLANAAAQVMIAEAKTPTLTPGEIEAACNEARAEIDEAIEQVRAIFGIEQSRYITEPLKDQALAIQEAGRAVIEQRPPLVLRTVSAPGNLRLIAHQLYGDHTRAPELYRLNNLRLPNFVQAGDQLNAYAK